MEPSTGLYPIKGKVQHYSWGGNEYIPKLLGLTNGDGKPYAEYWLGAHPNHPSVLLTENNPTLVEFIGKNPVANLGKNTAELFSSLPFLLKVLDVRQMLSIQVHPSIEAAIEGFEREETEGILRDAPHRNYKDENHKPELMMALGPFWLLHGFKEPEALKEVLGRIPELRSLLPVFEKKGYRGLYESVMLAPQDEIDTMLQPLIDRIYPLYTAGALNKDNEDFWAARAWETFSKGKSLDRGIFSIYFFNLVSLQKGDAIYQPSGVPHAYLEGQNIEVMANSDNVLRAGLTDKHVDVPELMKLVHFEATHPKVIRAEANKYQVYRTPAVEFELQQYRLDSGERVLITSLAAEIWLLLEGKIRVSVDSAVQELGQGDAFFLAAEKTADIIAGSSAVLFRVVVPDGGKNSLSVD
jgi:mannose-6-phosphate isomerase